jgi:glycerophosphoryl diester phosphodiesterase
MKKFFCLSVTGSILVFVMGCQSHTSQDVLQTVFPTFYKEGHRGTRGLMPENTIPSMKKALDDGANIIEVDIQISRDKKVMVAHDAHLNPQITLSPQGKEISEADGKQHILYQMDYAEIRQYDVGSKYHPDFPQQKKIRAYIPLLGELIDSVERYTREKRLEPAIYNIEIKASPDQDNLYHPAPTALIDLVMEVVKASGIKNRFYIQSFDIRQIQEVHNRYPGVVTGFLTSKKDISLEENIKRIGFNPEIYSPHYKLATEELIEKCHAQGMKFVPWTVNNLEEMQALKTMGVDGIITDYPNLFSRLE